MVNKIADILDELVIPDIRNMILDYSSPSKDQYTKVIEQLKWHKKLTLELFYENGYLGSFSHLLDIFTDEESQKEIHYSIIDAILQASWRRKVFYRGLKNPCSLID